MDILAYAKASRASREALKANIFDINNIDDAWVSHNADLHSIPVIYQELNVIASGTITGDGNVAVVVTAAGMSNSPKTVNVTVTNGDTAVAWAAKVKTALNADSDVSSFFVVDNSAAVINLTVKTPATYDNTMAITLANGSCTGVDSRSGTSLNGVVHTSVVYVPGGWNGYEYWMVYTPYPFSKSDYENPSVCASRDGETWVTPTGVTNPIVAKPASGYNADPVLTYANGIMYVTWKISYSVDQLWVVSSSDGFKTITAAVKILETAIASERNVSPAILYDEINNQFVMWTVDIVPATNVIKKRTCSTMTGTWSAPVSCTTNNIPAGLQLWHLDIKKYGPNYYAAVWCSPTDTGANCRIYFAKSTDGTTWNLTRNKIINGFEVETSKGFYKGSIIPVITEEGLNFDIWYSVLSSIYQWDLHKSRVRFNRTRLKEQYANSILGGVYLLPPILFMDMFKTDGELLTATCGKNWTADVSTFTVASGYASPTSATNTIYTYDIGVANHYVSVKLGALGVENYIVFRYVDPYHYWRFGNNGGNNYMLQKIGPQTIFIENAGVALAGDVISIECYGNTIKVYVNGDLRGTITDASLNTETKVGIQSNAVAAKFTEFFAKSV